MWNDKVYKEKVQLTVLQNQIWDGWLQSFGFRLEWWIMAVGWVHREKKPGPAANSVSECMLRLYSNSLRKGEGLQGPVALMSRTATKHLLRLPPLPTAPSRGPHHQHGPLGQSSDPTTAQWTVHTNTNLWEHIWHPNRSLQSVRLLLVAF